MMEKFGIQRNSFLRKETIGYYHQYYTGYKQLGNPDFVNTLKNTFNDTPLYNLRAARDEVSLILQNDIPQIMKENYMSSCILVCVPRAKAFNAYTPRQLMFKEAISMASHQIPGAVDGTDCIRRIQNTITTHLSKSNIGGNDGELPYPGITEHTCQIDTNIIRNQDIILIDDIYTKTVNIDEDCIQTLWNHGARNIIFYAIGYTRR